EGGLGIVKLPCDKGVVVFVEKGEIVQLVRHRPLVLEKLGHGRQALRPVPVGPELRDGGGELFQEAVHPGDGAEQPELAAAPGDHRLQRQELAHLPQERAAPPTGVLQGQRGQPLEAHHTRPGRGAHVRPVRKERPLHLKGSLFGNEKIERLSRERILHQLVANLVEAGAGLSRTGRSQEKAQAHPATPPAPRRTATGSPHAASSWSWVKRITWRSRASSARALRISSRRCSSQFKKGSSKMNGARVSEWSRSPTARRNAR